MGPFEAQARAQAALGKLAAALSTVRFEPGARGLESALARTLVRAAFVLVAERRALRPPELRALHEELAGAAEDGSGAFARLMAVLEGAGEPLPPWLVSAPGQDGDGRALLAARVAMVGAGDDDGLGEIERLGTAYESLLAASVEVAGGTSLALACRRKAGHAESAALVDLDVLLARRKGDRRRSLERRAVVITPRMAEVIGRAACVQDVAKAFRHRTSPLTPGVVAKGQLAILPAGGRRSSGSHYTKASLTARVVEDVLAPLLGDAPTEEAILRLRICDPAMGSGAFLLAACEHLAGALVEAWARAGETPSGDARARARRLVASRCLFGVDKDPVAVELARRSLWLFVRASDLPLDFADASLAVGDALLGPPLRKRTAALDAERRSFDWGAAFPAVFDAEPPGFDAMIGNPPWISYAGRAAQPLRAAVRAHFAANYESFAGYRNLQGLFIERAASLLRPGGRLGFIVPSSMSELDGYAPTRAAHDRLCAPDTPLRDLGAEEFPGVFQPCMALVSTSRARAWRSHRPSLGPSTRRSSTRRAARCSPSSANTAAPRAPLRRARRADLGGRHAPPPRITGRRLHVPLRAGSDIAPFQRKPPSFYCDPQRLTARLRPDGEWRKVAVLVRQTARVPMATLSDGLPFRNSILAGFADDHHPAPFLVAYLNATPIRWLHYARHRDARHGMPQLKVSHLRRTPRPPRPELVGELAALGERLSSENAGVDASAQDHLDTLVARAFALSEGECSLLRAWRERMAL